MSRHLAAGRRVVVVGGGIAGLAAAYALEQAGSAVTMVEGSPALGGKLRTSLIEGLAVDEGAEAFLAGVPEGVELARAVGLRADLVHPATSAASIAVGAALHSLPAGTVLGVPGDLDSLAASGLLTPAGLARTRAEVDAGGPLLGDISVGELVRARLGDEVVDRLVDPLLGGVYAGRADTLSLQATVPALAAALRTNTSLLAAAAAVRSSAPRASGPVFASLRQGLGALVPAVAARLEAEVLLRLPVREIRRTAEGFRLTTGPVPDPTYLSADAVVVAVPAAPAARLLREVAPAAASELAAIEYASTAIVTLAYPPAHLPPGSGVLVSGGGAVKALTFSSQKWAHLAGRLAIVRASVGRHGDEAVLQRGDADLVALAAAEVAALTGVAARPVASRVTRWGGALPQYAVGHLDRVRRIEAAVGAVPGLAVAGAAYRGVGVPACIRSGYAAAHRLTEHLARLGQSTHD